MAKNVVKNGFNFPERRRHQTESHFPHRYQALVEHSLNIGDLLDSSRKGLRHLVLTYQDLSAWMESMEQYLSKRKVLPVHMEKLLRQMDELAVSIHSRTIRDFSGRFSDVLELPQSC